MIVLRCTHKLLRELRLPKDELGNPGEGFLGSWFANLFRIDRRKCVIFTNDRTLYSFIRYGLKRDDFDGLNEVFSTALAETLLLDGIPVETVRKIYVESHPAVFGTTNSRSVLGSMNDLVKESMHLVPEKPQVTDEDIAAVNHRLNRTPMRTLNYIRPVLEMSTALEDWQREMEKNIGPPKIYVELKMSEREKHLVIDSPLSVLGFEDRFEKSPGGKHFVARLNRDEMEDLVEFMAMLANHPADEWPEGERNQILDKYSEILESMG